MFSLLVAETLRVHLERLLRMTVSAASGGFFNPRGDDDDA